MRAGRRKKRFVGREGRARPGTKRPMPTDDATANRAVRNSIASTAVMVIMWFQRACILGVCRAHLKRGSIFNQVARQVPQGDRSVATDVAETGASETRKAKQIAARNVRSASDDKNCGGGGLPTPSARLMFGWVRTGSSLSLVPGIRWKTICPEPVIEAILNMKQTGPHRKRCFFAFTATPSRPVIKGKGAILHPIC